MYEKVIGTDASEKQLEYAVKVPNVRYEHTQSIMSMSELENKVAPEGTVDVVTIAQSLHWFDLLTFYKQVKWVLKKPNGVIAAWCYTVPRVTGAIDEWLDMFYKESKPYWDVAREMVDDNYRGVDFPFEEVDGVEGTGPIEFVSEKEMDLERFLTYLRSWSAYQTAKEKGVELLGDDVVERLKKVWVEDGCEVKVAKFSVYLRIGKVGQA